MHKGRMEAFSDGVIAIIITIMVLELVPPHENDQIGALLPLAPIFLSYVLSFIYVGIYWNNHHHLLQAVQHVNGTTLWANLHLLFWLSLIPFSTTWMGETHFANLPVAIYGLTLLGCAIAFTILSNVLIALHGRESTLANAMGQDRKGKISLACYILGIPLAFVNSWLACAFFALVAVIWFIPDQRIEKRLTT